MERKIKKNAFEIIKNNQADDLGTFHEQPFLHLEQIQKLFLKTHRTNQIKSNNKIKFPLIQRTLATEATERPTVDHG